MTGEFQDGDLTANEVAGLSVNRIADGIKMSSWQSVFNPNRNVEISDFAEKNVRRFVSGIKKNVEQLMMGLSMEENLGDFTEKQKIMVGDLLGRHIAETVARTNMLMERDPEDVTLYRVKEQGVGAAGYSTTWGTGVSRVDAFGYAVLAMSRLMLWTEKSLELDEERIGQLVDQLGRAMNILQRDVVHESVHHVQFTGGYYSEKVIDACISANRLLMLADDEEAYSNDPLEIEARWIAEEVVKRDVARLMGGVGMDNHSQLMGEGLEKIIDYSRVKSYREVQE